MAETPGTSPGLEPDVFYQFEQLSPSQKRAFIKQKPGCDYSEEDENKNKVTCNNEGTHAVFGLKYETSAFPKDGLPAFHEEHETDYRAAGSHEDVRVYCPYHAEMERAKYQAKIGKQTSPTREGIVTVTEAAKMPVEKAVSSHSREYSKLFSHITRGLTLNYVRHSGQQKQAAPPLTDLVDEDEDEIQSALQDIFGKEDYEKAMYAPKRDLAEATSLTTNYVQDKPITAMDIARKELRDIPQEKLQTEAENKKVRTRLSKARKKNEYWCTSCQKSTKQNSNSCTDCGTQPILSTEVKSRPAGRPLKADDDNNVEAATYDVTSSLHGIYGNRLVTFDPKTGERRELPSTVDNMVDFVAGKGFMPTKDLSIPLVHQKSSFTRSHFAPMENFENAAGLVPRVRDPESQEGVIQYYNRRGEASHAPFAGPTPNTGPIAGEGNRISVTTNPEGEIVSTPVKTEFGKTEILDPSGMSLQSAIEEHQNFKERNREHALNVKLGTGVAPSTTCHECSFQDEKSTKIRKNITDATGASQGVCGKGHYTRRDDIPIALHEGKVVHVYARPTSKYGKAGREYDWIPTNEPAISRTTGNPITIDEVNRMVPFRHLQEMMSRRSSRESNVSLVNSLSRMRARSEEDPIREKLIETNKKRYKDYLDQGILDSKALSISEPNNDSENELR